MFRPGCDSSLLNSKSRLQTLVHSIPYTLPYLGAWLYDSVHVDCRELVTEKILFYTSKIKINKKYKPVVAITTDEVYALLDQVDSDDDDRVCNLMKDRETELVQAGDGDEL